MDSSSDGSFAWTDASNDTIDSEVKLNNNMKKLNSEDESVSGKTYKKNLQKELFAQSSGIVHDEHHQHKERKRKFTEGHSGNESFESPKKKKIKREPESDMDVSTRKSKTNGHNHNESLDSYDESYLKLKVKAEQQFTTPSPTKIKTKRNKNVSDSNIINEESFEAANNKTKRRRKDNSSEETELGDHKLDQLLQEENEYNARKSKKKKKSKKRKHSFMSNESQPNQETLTEEDITPAEESRVPLVQYAEALEDTVEKNNKKKKMHRSSTRDSDACEEGIEDTDRSKQQLETPINKSVTFNNHSKSVKRTTRISERIQFEEEDSSDVDTNQIESTKPSTTFSKLTNFLKENLNLKPFTSELKVESRLTLDDEIWIVRCPKDVDIEDFQNKDFTLQGKCKLKLNGQTYEGTVDDESGNISILSSEHNKYVIKSLPVKGYVSLRKRIPKTHCQDETMVNNQGNFIPLPETKCRHPLFGSNYRRAIKLPISVTECLKVASVDGGDTHSAPSSYKKKKKSQKTRPSPERDHTLKTEPNPISSVELDVESNHKVSNKKKKKKSKHSNPHQNNQMKHDLESAEAWESEQAIEENLFNF